MDRELQENTRVSSRNGAGERASASGTMPESYTVPPSSRSEVDRALAVLAAHKDAWARLDIPARIALLDAIKKDVRKVEKRWVAAAVAAKGGSLETMAEAEEWYGLTVTYRHIRFLRKALQDIARFGRPQIPGQVTTRPDGQVVAQVVPYDRQDRVALPGMRAEVWMLPSDSRQDGSVAQAAFYQTNDKKGRICAVLGAGNVAGLVPGDVLYKLFVEGQVVALKLNPVNEYMGPIFEEAFAAPIKAGYLQVLYGGAEVGSELCGHPAVDTLHLTGSDRTFEAIVFGPGAEGKQRKHAHRPLVTKPFSAELGNISPVIVVPGPWTEKDVQHQAVRLGSWLVPNAACNCNSPRMIIQMRGWEQRVALNQGIADFLARMPTRKAFYPGSFALHQQFVDAHPEALQLGEPREGHLPWTFIPDLDPANEDEICFQREPFMSLYSETAIDAGDVVEFIGKAVAFANEKLWGTLSASIVVHPASLKDTAVAAAVDRAIADLRYGSVVVNLWGALAHYMSITPWGGYPGADIYDVQSGIGFVNNPLMFDRVQKSVIYAGFAPSPDPFLAIFSNIHRFYRQDTRYNYDPSVANLLKLVWSALTLKKA